MRASLLLGSAIALLAALGLGWRQIWMRRAADLADDLITANRANRRTRCQGYDLPDQDLAAQTQAKRALMAAQLTKRRRELEAPMVLIESRERERRAS